MDARRQAEARLARALIEVEPEAAAAALEELSPAHAAEMLREAPAGIAARTLARMIPRLAGAALERLAEPDACERLARLSPRAAAAILRGQPAEVRERLVAGLDAETGRAVTPLLAYPEGTAGALMDPLSLALPADLDVKSARARAMEKAHEAHYNVYVVDRDGRLVGVLNLRELLASPERERLAAVMNEATYRLDSRAGRLEVIGHPGWKHVHSLPVVDDEGRFLGSIRFRTLRELEEQTFRERATRAPSAGNALGELYWTGMSGMLEALVTALAPGRGAGENGDGPRR